MKLSRHLIKMMAKARPIDFEYVFDQLRSGRIVQELADELGFHEVTLRKRIDKAGGMPEDVKKALREHWLAAKRANARNLPSIGEVFALIRSGKSVRDIVDETGCAINTLYCRLREVDLPEDVKEALRDTATSNYSKASIKRWQDPEIRAKTSESFKQVWADPKYKEKQRKKFRAAWARPDVQAMIGAVRTGIWARPGYKVKMSKTQKRVWEDPELRARASKLRKEWWKDRDFWEWLGTFPLEKRYSIIGGMLNKAKTEAEKKKRQAMFKMIELLDEELRK
jgi:hypothetical protein